MFLKKCASAVQKAQKKGWQCNKQRVTDFRKCTGNQARGNFPEVRNKTFLVAISEVLNSNNDLTSNIQLQASCIDVRHWMELIDFIEKEICAKEQCCLTAIY